MKKERASQSRAADGDEESDGPCLKAPLGLEEEIVESFFKNSNFVPALPRRVHLLAATVCASFFGPWKT